MAKQTDQDRRRAMLLRQLDALRSAKEIGRRVYCSLQEAVQRAARLPPNASTFDRWFRAACRHPDGADYSHAQRQVFCAEFNRVGDAWHQAGLLPEPLQAQNYPKRHPTIRVVNDAVHRRLTPGEFRRLRAAFLARLHPPLARPVTPTLYGEAFNEFFFDLITAGGLTSAAPLAAVKELTWAHLRPAVDGFLILPYRPRDQSPNQPAVPYRLFLHPRTVALALRLATCWPQKGHRAWPPAEASLLAPLETVSQTRKAFNDWLAGLCLEARAPVITLRTLALASRSPLAQLVGNSTAAALRFQPLWMPLALDLPEDLLLGYQDEFRPPQPGGGAEERRPAPARSRLLHPTAHATHGSRRQPAAPAGEDEPPAVRYLAEAMLGRVAAATRPLRAGDQPDRDAAARSLDVLARELLDAPGQESKTAFRQAQAALDQEQRPGQIEAFNVAWLAAWLAWLCVVDERKLEASSTVLDYRSAGAQLVRHLVGRRFDALQEDDLADIAALDLSGATRGKLLTVLTQLLTFGQESLELDFDRPQDSVIQVYRRPRPVRLLTGDNLRDLLDELARRAGGGDHLAHNVYLAALLGAFFGLRISEPLALEVGDLVLDAADPYLRVRRSKRGKSRLVYAYHVPPVALDALRDAWQSRLQLAGGDRSARFLTQANGEPISERQVDRVFGEALAALDLPSGEGRSITFHKLRHLYANRLLLLGTPLLDVARAVGHSDPDTTVGSYLHCFDVLHRQALQAAPAEPGDQGLTAHQIGALLGVTRQTVIGQLQELGLYITGAEAAGGKRLYPWATAVQYIARRLRLV